MAEKKEKKEKKEKVEEVAAPPAPVAAAVVAKKPARVKIPKLASKGKSRLPRRQKKAQKKAAAAQRG